MHYRLTCFTPASLHMSHVWKERKEGRDREKARLLNDLARHFFFFLPSSSFYPFALFEHRSLWFAFSLFLLVLKLFFYFVIQKGFYRMKMCLQTANIINIFGCKEEFFQKPSNAFSACFLLLLLLPLPSVGSWKCIHSSSECILPHSRPCMWEKRTDD